MEPATTAHRPNLRTTSIWAEHDAVEDAAWRAAGVYDVHDKLVVTD